MTNKYETLYAQIGACVDKLIERGFDNEGLLERFNFSDHGKHFIQVIFYNKNIDIWMTPYYRDKELSHIDAKYKAIHYSDPKWEEQLLNKVDELLKEGK